MKFCLVSAIVLATTISVDAGSAPIPFDKIDWKHKHRFMAPKKTDLRSPCPGLNTLANHGFLPRDGRGLTVENLIIATRDGYNSEPDAILLAAKVGLTASPNENSTFTLQDIRLHNSIEHDASVSRSDLHLSPIGDNFSFDPEVYATLAASNPGFDYYNATSAGEVQRLRLLDSQARNPDLINTPKEFDIRTRESGLYLSVMGNATTGQAPKKFVDVFFREERLPLAEGWKRSPVPINAASLRVIARIIATASQWAPNATQDSSVTFNNGGNKTLIF